MSATTSSRSPATGNRGSGKTSLLSTLCILASKRSRSVKPWSTHAYPLLHRSGSLERPSRQRNPWSASMTTTDPTAPVVLDEETISAYRRDGVVRIRNIISRDEAARFREAAAEWTATADDLFKESRIFNQYVNVWQQNDVLRELTLDPRLAAAAPPPARGPPRGSAPPVLSKPPHT